MAKETLYTVNLAEKQHSGGKYLRVLCENVCLKRRANQKLSLDFKHAVFSPIFADDLIYFQMTNGA